MKTILVLKRLRRLVDGNLDDKEGRAVKFGNFFNQLWRRIVHFKSPPEPPPPAMMKAMFVGLAHTQAQELSCDEVYVLLDIFADKISRGEDAAALMPLVQHHLEMCPDCREEYEALLNSMQATSTGIQTNE